MKNSDYDVYELERQWRSWIEMSEAEPPRKADMAFLGFCRKWHQKRQSGSFR